MYSLCASLACGYIICQHLLKVDRFLIDSGSRIICYSTKIQQHTTGTVQKSALHSYLLASIEEPLTIDVDYVSISGLIANGLHTLVLEAETLPSCHWLLQLDHHHTSYAAELLCTLRYRHSLEPRRLQDKSITNTNSLAA